MLNVLIIVLISFFWLNNYYNQVVEYPVKLEGEHVQINTDDIIVEFVEFPIEESVDISIISSDSNTNIFELEHSTEIILHGNNNLTILPSTIITVDTTRKIEVYANNIKVNLYKKECFIKSGSINYYGINNTWVYDDIITKECYVSEPIFFTGNELVNNLDIFLELERTMTTTQFVKVPFLFNEKHYTLQISIPTYPINIYEKHGRSEINVDLQVDVPFYRICEQYSGWIGWFTSRKDFEKGGMITLFRKPIYQNYSKYKDHVSIDSIFYECNYPSGFIITLIPDFQIYVILLSFLWVPLILHLFNIKKDKTHILKKIYIFLLVEIMGLNFAILLQKSQFTEVFYLIEVLMKVVHNWFLIILFLYPIFFTQIVNNINDTFTISLPIYHVHPFFKILLLVIFIGVFYFGYTLYLEQSKRVGLYETEIRISNYELSGNLSHPILNVTSSIINHSNKLIHIDNYTATLLNYTTIDGNTYNNSHVYFSELIENVEPKTSFNINNSIKFEFPVEIIHYFMEFKFYIREANEYRKWIFEIDITIE